MRYHNYHTDKDIEYYMRYRQLVKEKITKYPTLNMFRFIKKFGTYTLGHVKRLHVSEIKHMKYL